MCSSKKPPSSATTHSNHGKNDALSTATPRGRSRAPGIKDSLLRPPCPTASTCLFVSREGARKRKSFAHSSSVCVLYFATICGVVRRPSPMPCGPFIDKGSAHTDPLSFRRSVLELLQPPSTVARPPHANIRLRSFGCQHLLRLGEAAPHLSYRPPTYAGGYPRDLGSVFAYR